MVTVVAAGALVPRPEKPAMEGYEFAGWYTDESCTTAWNFDTDKVSANMILYGKWEVYVPPVPPELNITFDPNIPDQDETSTIVVMTGDYIPRPENPSREGYVFIGWYRDENCTTAWNFEVDKPEYHMTLYGGWEIEEIPEIVLHTITFRPNNGADNSIITVEDGALIPAPAQPEREGYTFTGWYTDEGCTVAWNLDTDCPVADMTLYGGWKKQESSGQEVHSDFLGLVEALLSTNHNCLNNSNVIFNAVQASWSSGKRPETHAPILHCGVNSISGGTMSSVAEEANAKLTSDLSFIFEVDPDPAYRNSRMRLYMYYTESCEDARDGDQIMVYQQIVTRGADGVWYADGTYIGKATVGNYFGGGNAGKRVKTISPYTWTYGYP